MSPAWQAADPYAVVLADGHAGDGRLQPGRANPSASRVIAAVIMMLTSGQHCGDAEHCSQLGVPATLLKPIRQAELRKARPVLSAPEQIGETSPSTRKSLRTAQDPSQSLRILLVEDNVVNQRVASRLLEKGATGLSSRSMGAKPLKRWMRKAMTWF